MYWWDRAAEILTAKVSVLRRFGLVTTNSITQDFSRRVMRGRMEGTSQISLLMAIPDHPWTKVTKEAAAVRIAMTVGASGDFPGVLREIVREDRLDTDQPEIIFVERSGRINPDLTTGIDVTSAKALRANEGVCSRGVALHGAGFIVTSEEAEHLGLGTRAALEKHIRPYRHGRDLTGHSRGFMVIDLDGLTSTDVRSQFPEVYQYLLAAVKPERDRNNEDYRRINWWLFGRRNTELRGAIKDLNRYVATVETATHRIFQYLDAHTIPDNKIVVIGATDAAIIGVLSSKIHVVWALRAGGMDWPRQ